MFISHGVRRVGNNSKSRNDSSERACLSRSSLQVLLWCGSSKAFTGEIEKLIKEGDGTSMQKLGEGGKSASDIENHSVLDRDPDAAFLTVGGILLGYIN